MIALDLLLWLRDALRGCEDVRSAEIEREDCIVVMLHNGSRMHIYPVDATGYVVPTDRQ